MPLLPFDAMPPRPNPVFDSNTGYDGATAVTDQGYPYWWLFDPVAYEQLKTFRKANGIEVDDKLGTEPVQNITALKTELAKEQATPRIPRAGHKPTPPPKKVSFRNPKKKKKVRKSRKSLYAIWDEMETKVVRHVRTAAGVRRFNQPIGSVIVRDGESPLDGLQAVANDFPGWQKLHGNDGNDYYVGKDAGTWVATDADDYEVVRANTEEDVYHALNKHVTQGTPVSSGRNPTGKEKPSAPKNYGVRKAPEKGSAQDRALRNDPNTQFSTMKDIQPGDRIYMDFGGVASEKYQRSDESGGRWFTHTGVEDRVLEAPGHPKHGQSIPHYIYQDENGQERAISRTGTGAQKFLIHRATTPEPKAQRGTGGGLAVRKMTAKERAAQVRKKNEDARKARATAAAAKPDIKPRDYLSRGRSEYPGYAKYTGNNGRTYYTAHDPDQGDYVAYDENDNELATGATEADMMRGLAEYEQRQRTLDDIKKRRPAPSSDTDRAAQRKQDLDTAVTGYQSMVRQYMEAYGEDRSTWPGGAQANVESLEKRITSLGGTVPKVSPPRRHTREKPVVPAAPKAPKEPKHGPPMVVHKPKPSALRRARMLRQKSFTVVVENKSLLDRLSTFQQKVVHHVRTEAGVHRFGQPIGSIIVRDGAPPLKNLVSVDSDYHGWEKVEGADGKHYYIGKFPDDDKWYVGVDNTDTAVVEDRTEEGVYKKLDAYVGKQPGATIPKVAKKPPPKTTSPRPTPPQKVPQSEWAKPRLGAKWDGNVLVTKEGNRVPIPPGFRPATEEEWKRDVVPPNSQMYFIFVGPGRFSGYGKRIPNEYKGKWQNQYSKEHHDKQKTDKFQRLKVVMSKMGKLDTALKNANLDKDDTAAVIYLMRLTGMRVGNEESAAGTAGTLSGEPTYGATTLLVKHAKVTANGMVTFKFVGKGGHGHTLNVKDQRLAETIRSRIATLDPDSVLFDTDSDQTQAYLKSKTGLAGIKNHDIRAIKATTMALAEIRKHKGELPKNKKEYTAWRNAIGDTVSAQLGNTRTMALNSYIMPSVFDQWRLDPSWK